jgi:hypothetical protein
VERDFGSVTWKVGGETDVGAAIDADASGHALAMATVTGVVVDESVIARNREARNREDDPVATNSSKCTCILANPTNKRVLAAQMLRNVRTRPLDRLALDLVAAPRLLPVPKDMATRTIAERRLGIMYEHSLVRKVISSDFSK